MNSAPPRRATRPSRAFVAALAGVLLLGAAGCRKKSAGARGPANAPLFREVAAETGLRFQHFIGASGQFYLPEIMGSGAALIDYDNDGDLDVFLVQGTMLDPGKTPSQSTFPPPAGWTPGNRLFRNELAETGRLHFTDVTGQAGVGNDGYGMGVAAGDYDGDGYVDLYVTNFGHNLLYHNNGNGTFTDVTRQAGVDDPRWSTSAAFFDFDNDGKLDLIVMNYVDFTIAGNKKCYVPSGERDYCTPKAYHPLPARLFHNLGGGRFADVTDRSGIGSALGAGLGVLCADFNGDGRVDVYVANDASANFLWLNQGDGTFRESALAAGVAYSADGSPQAGMGVTAADYDGDGDDDILVTNLIHEGVALYRNEGRGLFTESSAEAGLLQATFPFTGFGTEWFDYDNDGKLDLFIANGGATMVESLRGEPYPFHQTNQLFHNEGAGRRFAETGKSAGEALALSEVSRGAAFGDIDNDGDIDILISNNNGPVRLLLNEAGSRGGYWLEFRLKGANGNTAGIGARVMVEGAGVAPLARRVHADSSYLSANDPRLHFGLGPQSGPVNVVVNWPDGRTERWNNVQPDQQMTLREGTGGPR